MRYSLDNEGKIVLEATVSEIHGYPSRPEGYCEPLFSTAESRGEIAEHLLNAPWLSRASEIEEFGGCSAHVIEEPIRIQRYTDGRVEILRPSGEARRCSWRRRRVVEVLMRWREVRSWWLGDECVDRMLLRVVVSGGAIVDLAVDRSGAWTLTGVVD